MVCFFMDRNNPTWGGRHLHIALSTCPYFMYDAREKGPTQVHTSTLQVYFDKLIKEMLLTSLNGWCSEVLNTYSWQEKLTLCLFWQIGYLM